MVRKKLTSAKSKLFVPKRKRANRVAAAGKLLNTTCSEELLIGRVLFGATMNFPPEKWVECRLSFICKPEELEMIHLKFDEISVLVTLIFESDALKEIVAANIFSFNFEFNNQDVFMNLHFRELPLPKFNSRIGRCLKNVFLITHEFNFSDSDVVLQTEQCGAQEINKLYKLLSESRMSFDNSILLDVQHTALKPILRAYQKEAIKWMLYREQTTNEENEMIHPLYTPLKLPSGLEIYYNKYSGYLTPSKPVVLSNYKGGILAEEMGLGKTVEVIALILNHPYISIESQSIECPSLSEIKPESDEEQSDNDNADYPIIKRQAKKRTAFKKAKLQVKEDDKYEYKSVDIQVPADWVKKNKQKTSIRLALELWYNSALSEVNHKPVRNIEKLIECICSETYKSGKIMCVDCGKYQHQHCLGYHKNMGPYHCPSCWVKLPPVESSATLIVTPLSLRTQWCNEIKTHVNKRIRVLVYEGSRQTPVYPTYLKNFDIVITTYNVLQSEFHLTENEQVRELRRKRKYDYPGSPLSRIKWWRLCLDEAQTVDAPGKIVSSMAKKLTAEYRWAVTGTPISKNISDLFGLIDYLQIEPYNDIGTWTNILYEPFLRGNVQPLRNFLSKIMWRSSKSEVVDQIDIPQQQLNECSLEFSAVEKFFYNKEHELSSEAFLTTLRNIDTTIPLTKLDKGVLKKIMTPLLSLRQVCTHPQTVKGRYLATTKKVTSMKELLEALIVKNSTESEEHLRLVVSSLNGLAGIHLIMQNPQRAAEEYRKVMQLSARFCEDNKEHNLTVDKLQLIHTMHNLVCLLEGQENLPPTLHDSTLRTDCRLLEQKYIEKFLSNTLTAYQDSSNAQVVTNNLLSKFVLKLGQWYSDGLDWVIVKDLREELLNKIRNQHDNASVKCPIELTCERSILYFVAQWDKRVTNYRADLVEDINRLFTYQENENYKILIDQNLVDMATDCHLRPDVKSKNKRKKCPLCIANDRLKLYESKLFFMTKRTSTFEEMSLQGSWKPSSQEIILRALLGLLRAKTATKELIEDGEVHVAILDNLKKEFKDIRKLWTQIHQQVAAQDELDMCKIKLRLEDPVSANQKKNSKDKALKRLSYILENKLDTIYMLNEHELDYHMMLLKSDEAKGTASLEKSLGVRSYLETLKKQQYGGENPDPCPICRNALDQHWSILPCGHNYCMECLHKLLGQVLGAKIACCVCRQSQPVQDISYIRSNQINSENINEEIKGNFSTKVEGIIRFLMQLKSDDENIKVLVFSTWINVLKFLKDALILNGIVSEILLPSKLEERIENFKDEKKKITALLLPISLGGKGLNLIEATHVILIEPLLNPGDELQAIGRVHRIGQTRPTFVHKFFIKNTIEESILTATGSDINKWDKNKVTLEQVKELFERVNQVTNGSAHCEANAVT